MTNDIWTRCPLGVKLHRHLGTVDALKMRNTGIFDETWLQEKAYSNLQQFSILLTNGADGQNFRQSLKFCTVDFMEYLK